MEPAGDQHLSLNYAAISDDLRSARVSMLCHSMLLVLRIHSSGAETISGRNQTQKAETSSIYLQTLSHNRLRVTGYSRER